MNKDDLNKKISQYHKEMSVFVEAKEKTLHSLTRFGRKHKMLKWPMFIILVAILFVYNACYYLGLHLHLKDKFARGIAVAMTVVIFVSAINMTSFVTSASNDNEKAKVIGISEVENITVSCNTAKEDLNLPSTLHAVIEEAEVIYVSQKSITGTLLGKVALDGGMCVEDMQDNDDLSNENVFDNNAEQISNENSNEENANNTQISENGEQAGEDDANSEQAGEDDTNSEQTGEDDANSEQTGEENANSEQTGEDIAYDNELSQIGVNEITNTNTNTNETVSENQITNSEQTSENQTVSDNSVNMLTTSDNSVSDNSVSLNAVSQTFIVETDLSVTWQCDDYNGSVPGTYVFSAVLPTEYDGIELEYLVEIPKIEVTVASNMKEISTIEDDVKITVFYDEGVFPDNVSILADSISDNAVADDVDDKVDKVRNQNDNIADEFIFDIRIFDENGMEIQPDISKGNVYVKFEYVKIADANLETTVYHVHEDDVEVLNVEEEENEAVALTDSFSYYVVEFTYGDLEYVLTGGSKVELNEILNEIGLVGDAENAISSDEQLFNVYAENDVWYLESLNSFTSEETLTVTINGTEYVVKVTDGINYHFSATPISSTYEPTQIVNGDFNEYPSMSFLYGGHTYARTSLPNKGTFIAGTTISPIYNGVGEGWNTTEIKISAVGLLYDYCKIVGVKSNGSPIYDTYSIEATYNDTLYNWVKNNKPAITSSNPYSFIEMNYNARAVFWQDLKTTGGDVIVWSLEHANRGGNQVLEAIHVEIGAPNKDSAGNLIPASGYDNQTKNTNITSETKASYTYSGASGTYAREIQGKLKDLQLPHYKGESQNDFSGWREVKSIYIVPDNQNVTRFAFISDAPATSADGNLMDSITFNTLIGNLSATQLENGDVKVTGYWGETDDKALVCKIGSNEYYVDMSAIRENNTKSFSVIIPKNDLNGATQIEVYHQDYETAKRTVKVYEQNVAIGISTKFDETPKFDTHGVELKYKLTALSATDAEGNPINGIPMPATDTVTFNCPNGTEEVGFDSEHTPWKFTIIKPGTYRYKVSYVDDNSNIIKEKNSNIVVVNVEKQSDDSLKVTYQLENSMSALQEGDFTCTIGNEAAGGGIGAKYQFENDEATLVIGGSTPVSFDAFDSAALKCSVPIDFTKAFEIKGKISSAIAPDGMAIGFVPDKTPQSPSQVHKYWLNGIFGGTLDYNNDALVPVNGNGVFMEFDCWGNHQGLTNVYQAPDDAYLKNKYGCTTNLNGRHIVLLKTDANGVPASSDGGIVTKSSYINMSSSLWPTSPTNYCISHVYNNEKNCWELNFKVYKNNSDTELLVDLTWEKPEEVFKGNSSYTKYAYLVFGANVRFGPKNSTTYGVTSTPATSTISIKDLKYKSDWANEIENTIVLTGYNTSEVTLNPTSIVDSSHKGTEKLTVKYGEKFANITTPYSSSQDFLGYYDENGKMYIDNTGKCNVNWDKGVKAYTLTAKYKALRENVSVQLYKGESNINSYVYGENVTVKINKTLEETPTVKYYYIDSQNNKNEWLPENPPKLNVGTYKLYAEIEATAGYMKYETPELEFSVTKADYSLLDANKPTAKNLTCNGKMLELIVPGTTSEGKFVYSLEENGTYTEDIPTAKKTGKYTIYYKIVGMDNYNDYVCSEPLLATIKNPSSPTPDNKGEEPTISPSPVPPVPTVSPTPAPKSDDNPLVPGVSPTPNDSSKVKPSATPKEKTVPTASPATKKEPSASPTNGTDEEKITYDEIDEGVTIDTDDDNALMPDDDKKKLEEACLTPEEKEDINNGESVIISLNTKDDNDKHDSLKSVSKILDSLSDENKIAIACNNTFTIELSKQVGDRPAELIKETDEKLPVMIMIDEELMVPGASYYVIDEDGNKIEAKLVNEDGQYRLVFETNNFDSKYQVIMVADKEEIDKDHQELLSSSDYISGKGQENEGTCAMHWFSIIVMLISLIAELATRKNRNILLGAGVAGIVATVIMAVLGTCFVDWIVAGVEIVATLVICFLNFNKKHKIL